MPQGQYNNWVPNNYYGTQLYNQSYQPQMLYNNIMRQPINNLLRVTGLESAKAYPAPPNSDIVLFDGEKPLFYWKSTDDSGFANIRTFIFEEQKQEMQPIVEQTDISNFVTKEDLSELKETVFELKQMLEGLVN